MIDLLTHGFHAGDLGLLADRLALGSFFTISGWHKAFHPVRRASLKATFIADGCYTPALMFVIPGAELLGGLALVAGFLTVPAALGLILICLGACALDGLKRVKGYAPLDPADYCADVLYLPEVLYIAMLALLVATGPGRYAVDAFLWGMLS